ncbi:hypothetical protein ACQPZG_20400 [Streptomyces sp. CA-294286]|uniref:hypothetical protein n=1 Tax=Streptomyces sp. CA-294286 TaxID=3240070 RepID=UPI003D8EF96D
MIEPFRRGHLEQPSGQIHGTSFNITPVGNHRSPSGQVAIRLSALVATFALVWILATKATMDAAESAFIVTLLGFTWHAGVNVTWVQGK